MNVNNKSYGQRYAEARTRDEEAEIILEALNDYSQKIGHACRCATIDMPFVLAILRQYAKVFQERMPPEALDTTDALIKMTERGTTTVAMAIPRGFGNDA